MSSETSPQFDPKKGFVININEVAESGYYTCKPKHPSIMNQADSVDILVQWISKSCEFQTLSTNTVYVNVLFYIGYEIF